MLGEARGRDAVRRAARRPRRRARASRSTRPTTSPCCPTRAARPGLPKGVMLTHRNLVANLVPDRCRARDRARTTMLIGVLPFFHIYGMTVIMNLGLRTGATVVTMPRFDLEQFLDLIEEHTRHARLRGAADRARARQAPGGRRARPLVAADDHVRRRAARRRARRRRSPSGSTARSIQGYGMTETSPVTHVDPPRRARTRPGSIGPPLPEHRVPARRPRERRGRRRGRARRALDPRPAGDERLPQQRRGDRGDDRRRRLAAHRRHRRRRRGRLLRDRRPAQGADQVQGIPGRAGRARGAADHPPGRSPTSP